MFDDIEGRIYHEVLLAHQKLQYVIEPDAKCTCGWVMSVGFDTHLQHVAHMVALWLEHNLGIDRL